MKLRILDDSFFEFFRICPTKGVYSFKSENKLVDNKKQVYQDKTADRLRYELIMNILRISMLTLEKKGEITFKQFTRISNVVLKRALKTKQNEILEPIKNDIIIDIEKDNQKIFEMIDQSDLVNIHKRTLSGYFEINDMLEKPSKSHFKLGSNYKMKKKYVYHYDLPFITQDSNQFNLIKFTTTGIPKTFEEFNYDLGISIWIAKKLFPRYIFKSVIVYDVQTLERTVLNINEVDETFLINDLFKRFFIIDTNSTYKNFGAHCEECINKHVCFSELLRLEIYHEIYDEKIKGKKLNILEKRKILRDEFKKKVTDSKEVMG